MGYALSERRLNVLQETRAHLVFARLNYALAKKALGRANKKGKQERIKALKQINEAASYLVEAVQHTEQVLAGVKARKLRDAA